MENDIVLMQEGKRASKPAGFSLRECWADALDFDPTSARGQAAAYMYRYVMDGVRIMLKFEEWDHMPARVEVIRRRIARARSYGCDIHLCIDWFKVATGPGSYHKGMWKPSTNTMIDMVAEMLAARHLPGHSAGQGSRHRHPERSRVGHRGWMGVAREALGEGDVGGEAHSGPARAQNSGSGAQCADRRVPQWQGGRLPVAGV